MKTLPVHFRLVQNDLIAVFPSLWDGAYLTCYALVGQHSACAVGYARGGRPARPEEYASLLQHLRGIYETPPPAWQETPVALVVEPRLRIRRNEARN